MLASVLGLPNHLYDHGLYGLLRAVHRPSVEHGVELPLRARRRVRPRVAAACGRVPDQIEDLDIAFPDYAPVRVRLADGDRFRVLGLAAVKVSDRVDECGDASAVHDRWSLRTPGAIVTCRGASTDFKRGHYPSAGRVFDKFHAQLDPLIGAAGVRALLMRSAKLVQSEYSFLDIGSLEGSVKLRECLRAQKAADARGAAVALCGTFIALVATFIGERLTTHALRGAWGTIDETAPTGKTK